VLCPMGKMVLQCGMLAHWTIPDVVCDVANGGQSRNEFNNGARTMSVRLRTFRRGNSDQANTRSPVVSMISTLSSGRWCGTHVQQRQP
jgi:hypothetical protein